MNVVVETLLVADVLWDSRRRVEWFKLFSWLGALGFCVFVWGCVAHLIASLA